MTVRLQNSPHLSMVNVHTQWTIERAFLSCYNSGGVGVIFIWCLKNIEYFMDLFLLLESFKLETKFINIQQDTPTITGLIPVEQILKNFQYCSKVLEYGIHYRPTSKMLRNLTFSIFKRTIKSFLRVRQNAT